MKIEVLRSSGISADLYIWLQILVSCFVPKPPSACRLSVGMLSMPMALPFFICCKVVSTSCEVMSGPFGKFLMGFSGL